MISIDIRTTPADSDKEILLCSLWVNALPRVGEHLWFTDRENLKTLCGETCFVVTDVAHWINSSAQGNKKICAATHHACVYVMPISSELTGIAQAPIFLAPMDTTTEFLCWHEETDSWRPVTRHDLYPLTDNIVVSHRIGRHWKAKSFIPMPKPFAQEVD